MRGTLILCGGAVAAVVGISLYSCRISPAVLGEKTCKVRDDDIPPGYMKDQCHCVKNSAYVPSGPSDSDDWDHLHGRKSPGESTVHNADGTTATRTVNPSSRWQIACEKPEQFKPIESKSTPKG